MLSIYDTIKKLNQIDREEIREVILSNGCSFEIKCASFWRVENEGDLICDYLGNVPYSSSNELAEDLFKALAEDKIEIVSIEE